MPDIANRYLPGQPVDDPQLFFGRQDVLASIPRQLAQGQRVFVVSGARRIGKTSLLRQLPTYLPEGFVPVEVGLLAESDRRLDRLLWRLADGIGQQVSSRLGVEGLAPAWADFEGQTDCLLDRFWPQIRAALGDQRLILMLDDLDSLRHDEANLLDPLVAILSAWHDRDEGLSSRRLAQSLHPGDSPELGTPLPAMAMAMVLTVSATRQEALMQAYPRLLGKALTYVLGPLTSAEAARLITQPVQSAITYDHDAVQRLIEIASGQPYYLQWFCFELFDRCARAGRVSRRNVDLLAADLINQDIADFRQIWDASSPQEQLMLAALVSLRGTRGVATAQDVRIILNRTGADLEHGQVVEVLESLASRGVLERLGASSYRFGVALLQDWLRARIDLQEVAHDICRTAKSQGRPARLLRWTKGR
jgi:hypothetical protein